MNRLNFFVFPRPGVSTELFGAARVEDVAVQADFLVIDSVVKGIYGDRLPRCNRVAVVPGGEACKTLQTVEALWREMHLAAVRRDSTVVVIGGGAVCDVAAFAASTWKRGVNLVLVPTTLLAMVDASIGGKTAINTDGEKNQAGTVYPASKVVVCIDFLKTLPDKEMVNGLSEALKTAVIGDRKIVRYLREKDYSSAVSACVAVKAGIVASDLEETGERRLLNLGHTVGHCIEAASGFSVSHGQAVAMGIPIAAGMGGNSDFAGEIREVAHSLGIETQIPSAISLDDVLEHLDSDKKTVRTGRYWVIPNGWEDCRLVVFDRERERELLEKAWP